MAWPFKTVIYAQTHDRSYEGQPLRAAPQRVRVMMHEISTDIAALLVGATLSGCPLVLFLSRSKWHLQPETALTTDHRSFSIPRFFSMLCFVLLFQALSTISPAHCAEKRSLTLDNYTFHPLPDYAQMETVCFRFSQDYLPEIKSLGGEHPRLFFDLQPAVGSDLETEEIANGKLVRSIRAFLHQDDERLRVVVDLAENFDYQVEQRYVQNENTLCLIIQAEE